MTLRATVCLLLLTSIFSPVSTSHATHQRWSVGSRAQRVLPSAPALNALGARSLPVSFEPNRGQAPAGVLFVAHGPSYTLELKRGGARLIFAAPANSNGQTPHGALGPSMHRLRTEVLTLQPTHSGNPAPVAMNSLPGRINYFIGRDPHGWITGVPTFGAVAYRNLYPHIDLVFHMAGARPEYDWVLHPGSDPSRIRLAVRGMRQMAIRLSGSVIGRGPWGQITQLPPHAYQIEHGRQIAVAARYHIEHGAILRLSTGHYDGHRTLVVDPVIAYATYIGGSKDELAADVTGIDVDQAGNAYVSGDTRSFDFPVVNALQPAHETDTQDQGNDIGFIAKVSPDGRRLLYATYIGGNGSTSASTLRLDAQGNIFVAGDTTATDFPLVNPLQGDYAGVTMLFIAELDPAGNRLTFSTYYGGHNLAFAGDLEISRSGEVYLVGETFARDFPVKNAQQPAFAGSNSDAYVIGLMPSQRSVVFSTFLGGDGPVRQSASHAALDPDGGLLVVGETPSTSFPTLHPYQASNLGGTCGTGQDARPCSDGFIARFTSRGRLTYSTYLGGNSDDAGRGIALDRYGDIWVTGTTSSPDFPTVSPLQGNLLGSSNAFVTELDRTGQHLLFSTYLGGSFFDFGDSIGINPVGDILVSGSTASNDFPLVNPTQSSLSGQDDVFVTEIDPAPAQILFSTYLGSPSSDEGSSIVLDHHGNAYVFFRAGIFSGNNTIPTVNGFQATPGGGSDGFLAKFGALPEVAPRGR